ncbi:MAG: hypothetical protein WBS20_15610 [Lysobacterales bacterium]
MSDNKSQTTETRNTNNGGSAPTTQQLRSSAHEVVDQAADRAEEVETKVREGTTRLAEKTEKGKAEAKQQIDETLEKVDGFIRKRPVASAGIAFGAGVVVTLLMKR